MAKKPTSKPQVTAEITDTETVDMEFLQPYLEAYPDESLFYVTSDKQVFLAATKNDALNHQRTIDPEKLVIEAARP